MPIKQLIRGTEFTGHLYAVPKIAEWAEYEEKTKGNSPCVAAQEQIYGRGLEMKIAEILSKALGYEISYKDVKEVRGIRHSMSDEVFFYETDFKMHEYSYFLCDFIFKGGIYQLERVSEINFRYFEMTLKDPVARFDNTQVGYYLHTNYTGKLFTMEQNNFNFYAQVTNDMVYKDDYLYNIGEEILNSDKLFTEAKMAMVKQQQKSHIKIAVKKIDKLEGRVLSYYEKQAMKYFKHVVRNPNGWIKTPYGFGKILESRYEQDDYFYGATKGFNLDGTQNKDEDPNNRRQKEYILIPELCELVIGVCQQIVLGSLAHRVGTVSETKFPYPAVDEKEGTETAIDDGEDDE